MREQGRGVVLLWAATVMACGSLLAFQPIPKESAKALGVTRGKPFSSGVVFVNGKFIEPPYTIERWGTGIRINQIPVTGQIVSWNEFLKTQTGAKVEKRTDEPVTAPAAIETAATAVEDSLDALDALFGGDQKQPADKSVRPASAPAVASPVVSRTEPVGAFVPNKASCALLKRINDARTEIDRLLRGGGFICLGDNYSRVTGDKRTLSAMMEVLPDLLRKSATVEAFNAGVRSAGLVYLNEVLCEDLFRNRADYRKLQKRSSRIRSAEKWDRILQEVYDPVF